MHLQSLLDTSQRSVQQYEGGSTAPEQDNDRVKAKSQEYLKLLERNLKEMYNEKEKENEKDKDKEQQLTFPQSFEQENKNENTEQNGNQLKHYLKKDFSKQENLLEILMQQLTESEKYNFTCRVLEKKEGTMAFKQHDLSDFHTELNNGDETSVQDGDGDDQDNPHSPLSDKREQLKNDKQSQSSHTGLFQICRSMSESAGGDHHEYQQILINRYLFGEQNSSNIQIRIGINLLENFKHRESPLEKQIQEDSQFIQSKNTKQLINATQEDFGSFMQHPESLFNHIQIRNKVYFFSVELMDGPENLVKLHSLDLSKGSLDIQNSEVINEIKITESLNKDQQDKGHEDQSSQKLIGVTIIGSPSENTFELQDEKTPLFYFALVFASRKKENDEYKVHHSYHIRHS